MKWTGLIWLRVGTSSWGLLNMGMYVGFHKIQGIC